jgi:hypothetical protein
MNRSPASGEAREGLEMNASGSKPIRAMSVRSHLILPLACFVLAACGGGSAPSGDGGLGPLQQIFLGSLTVTPDVVLLPHGQSATVRVDTTLLPPGDGVTGYSIGTSEMESHIDIDTAPCFPASSGSASCQDWTITPLPGAVPGEHLIDIKSVGARSGYVEGALRVRVIGSPVQTSAIAVDHGVAHRRPFSNFDGPTLVLLSDGRIAAAGSNGWGQVGVGYRPFNLGGIGQSTSRPWVVDEFVTVAGGTLFEYSAANRGRWLKVAASGGISYALRDDNTLWAWGDTGNNLLADPFSPRQFTQLPPLTDIAAGASGGLAIAADRSAWALGDLRYQEHASQLPPAPIMAVDAQGARTPLTNVFSVAGSVATTAMFIRRDGSVWLQHDGQEDAQAMAGLSSEAIGIAVAKLAWNDDSAAPYYLVLLADGTLIEGRHGRGGETVRTVAVPGSNFRVVSAGAEFAYALRRDGTVWSWRPFTTAPTQIAGLSDVVSLGPDHAIRGNCPDRSGELWRIFDGTDAARLPEFRSGTGVGCSLIAGGTFVLTIETTGPGYIEVLPAGQVCRGRCDIVMSAGVAVRLRPPFANLENGPHSDPRCVLAGPTERLAAFSFDRDMTCRYSFDVDSGGDEQIPLTINLDGPGRVTSAPPGIDCGSACTTTNLRSEYTFLTPVAASGFLFDSFIGDWDCERGIINRRARAHDLFESRETGRPPLMSTICTAKFVPLAAPPSARLDIAVVGNGDVVSDPAAINCGSVCRAVFTAGTTVRLEPRPQTGYRFFEWSGNADCRDGTLTLSSDQACTATFVEITAPPTATLTIAVSGSGKVAINPPGVECGPTCVTSYPIAVPASVVSLVPVPDPGGLFSGWGGDCAGVGTTSVAMDVSKACTATFAVPPPSGWQPVGGTALSQSFVYGMSIAVNVAAASGPVIYAAVAQRGAGNHVDLVVYRFNGTNWEPVGGNLIESGVISDIGFAPAIAIDSGGALTVAWSENRQRIRVKQWNGTDWVPLGGVLNIDTSPSTEVFDTQLAVSASGSLVVAWLETAGSGSIGRMALKRYNRLGQWTGDYVLPTNNNVVAIRLTTEVLGQAMLMFVPFDAASASQEGPLRVIRQDNFGLWSDVCTPLTRPSAAGAFYPNTEIGFGISASGIGRGPVAIFNNGEAIFAVKCSGPSWTGLDDSALGQVAAVGQGETLYALSVNGNTLAWSKVRQLLGPSREIRTQVMVENNTATALVESGPSLTFFDASFNQGSMSHTTLPPSGSPVLAGVILDNGAYYPWVYRYQP